MSNILKVIGIIGAGAVLAVAASSGGSPSDSNSTKVTSPAVEVVPSPSVVEVVPAEAKADLSLPTNIPKAEKASTCDPNYSGCLKMNAGDYDCAGGSGNGPNFTGEVQVLGNDHFGLDRDRDGWACE
jgi:hypothetical protein